MSHIIKFQLLQNFKKNVKLNLLVLNKEYSEKLHKNVVILIKDQPHSFKPQE